MLTRVWRAVRPGARAPQELAHQLTESERSKLSLAVQHLGNHRLPRYRSKVLLAKPPPGGRASCQLDHKLKYTESIRIESARNSSLHDQLFGKIMDFCRPLPIFGQLTISRGAPRTSLSAPRHRPAAGCLVVPCPPSSPSHRPQHSLASPKVIDT